MATLQRDIILPDETATLRLGEDLALALRAGDCLALNGALGAGKSTLARAVIRGMADDAALDVPSPTFTLVQTYPLRIAIAHFDLYRISDPEELIELGLDEALLDGAVLIEWPERAGARLPPDSIAIRISDWGNGRRVTIDGPQEAIDRIDRSLAIRDFLDAAGHTGAERRYLVGDASVRRYETVRRPGQPVRLLMDSPRRELGPVIRDGKRYAEIAHSAEDIVPFLALDRFLATLGFRVPAIEAEDRERGLALLEYLGDDGVVDDDGRPVAARWEAAIDCLVHLHAQDIPAAIARPGGGSYRIPPFDADAMMIEAELFIEWYFPFRHGRPAPPDLCAAFETGWRAMIGLLTSAETGLVLRDFHSPNLLWQDDETGIRRVGLIDFQDAMIGPVAYDVASLVQDARVTIEPGFAALLLRRYEAARQRAAASFDAAAFRRALAIMQAQRATKLLGLFVRLRERDGKPSYVRHVPRAEAYLRQALKHPVLGPLRACYTDAGIALDES